MSQSECVTFSSVLHSLSVDMSACGQGLYLYITRLKIHCSSVLCECTHHYEFIVDSLLYNFKVSQILMFKTLMLKASCEQ